MGMVDEPASDEVAVAPASAETAAETSAGEYNQGVDACIYADAPATLVETASAVPDFSTLVGEYLGLGTAQVLYIANGSAISYRSNAKKVVGSGSNATIVQGNVWSCNGVIQVIDEVLLPESALSSDQ